MESKSGTPDLTLRASEELVRLILAESLSTTLAVMFVEIDGHKWMVECKPVIMNEQGLLTLEKGDGNDVI